MYIYNITTKVTHEIQEAWVQWMKEIHIPEIMQTGCFTQYRFVKLLEQDEADGLTFALMLHANSLANYQTYLNHYAPDLKQDAQQKWGNATIGFRSLMEHVH